METEVWTAAGLVRYAADGSLLTAADEDRYRAEKLAGLGLLDGRNGIITTMTGSVEKVGPKGYIHGWIKVGTAVRTPKGAYGRVSAKPGNGRVEVEFHSPVKPVGNSKGPTQHFHEDELSKPSKGELEEAAMYHPLPPARKPAASDSPAPGKPPASERSQREMDNYFGRNTYYGPKPVPPNPKKLTDDHLKDAYGRITAEYQRQIWLPPDQYKRGVANRLQNLAQKIREEARSRGIEQQLEPSGPPPSAAYR